MFFSIPKCFLDCSKMFWNVQKCLNCVSTFFYMHNCDKVCVPKGVPKHVPNLNHSNDLPTQRCLI